MKKQYTHPYASVQPVALISHIFAGSGEMDIQGGGPQTGARAPQKPF